MADEQKNNSYKTAALLLSGALIGILICWFLFGRHTGSAGDVTTRTDSVTHYVFFKDTSKHTIEKHYITAQPVNYYNVEYHTDTAAILRDYFTKKLVNDSIQDTLVKIWVKDTLYKNNITYRKYDWKFLKPYQVDKNTTITTTVTINKYPNGIYVGPRIEFNPATKQIVAAAADIDFTTRHFIIGSGYDFMNKGIVGKVTFKIFGK